MSLVRDRILGIVISRIDPPGHSTYVCHLLAPSSVQSSHYMFVTHHPQRAVRGQSVLQIIYIAHLHVPFVEATNCLPLAAATKCPR